MNLVTGTTQALFTGAFGNHFDTFSAHTDLVIFKRPIKELTLPKEDVYAGYGSNQYSQAFSFTEVSGVFPAMEIVSKIENDTFGIQTKTRNPEIETLVKVKPEAKDFIQNGGNDRFIINGKTYNDISLERVQNFFGLKYYYFNLKRTD